MFITILDEIIDLKIRSRKWLYRSFLDMWMPQNREDWLGQGAKLRMEALTKTWTLSQYFCHKFLGFLCDLMEEVTGRPAFAEIKFLSNQVDRDLKQVYCNREEKIRCAWYLFHMFSCEITLSSLSLPT